MSGLTLPVVVGGRQGATPEPDSESRRVATATGKVNPDKYPILFPNRNLNPNI